MCSGETDTPANPGSGPGAGSGAGGCTESCPEPQLEIVDRKTGNVVSGTTQNTVVGKKIELLVRTRPTGHTMTNIQWTISGTTAGSHPASTVKTYTMSAPRTDAPTPLAAADLQGVNLDFHWVPVHGEGSQTVEVAADVDGSRKQASVTFNVQCPTLDNFTSATGAIGVGSPWGSLELHCGSPATPGIRWTARVTPPAGGDGQIKFTQLVRSNSTQTPTSGPMQTWTIPDWWLDVSDPYGSTTSVTAGAQATATENDSPGQPLLSGFRQSVANDRFKLYLMYRPSGGDSIWVPLGLMNWGWTGTANRSGTPPTWSMTSGSHNAANPSGSKTGEFPTWVDQKTDSPPHPTWL